jgi:hypothetical protein
MSNAGIAIQNDSSLTLFADTGVSDDAASLQSRLANVVSYLFQNATFGEPLRKCLEVLSETVKEASTLNWDGYDARPVSELGYYKARQFLESLPTSVPIPEIGVDPDGDISFDWYSGANNVFSVSVSDMGRLTYAGIFGLSKVHGVEYYGDEIPRIILINLRRLWDEGLNH